MERHKAQVLCTAQQVCIYEAYPMGSATVNRLMSPLPVLVRIRWKPIYKNKFLFISNAERKLKKMRLNGLLDFPLRTIIYFIDTNFYTLNIISSVL